MVTTHLKELKQFTKTLKVLYVEDNKEARKSTLLMLENFFDTIHIAVDGDDGYEQYLNYYKVNNHYFDLVISDINMPKMDGTEMCKLIFNQNKKQHIIIVSAYNDSNRLEELLNMGISNFIHKPIKLDKFIFVLKEISNNIKTIKNKNNEIYEIEQLNNELDSLVDSFDKYVIASRTDLKGVITYASKAYEIISGYKENELLGQPHNIVRHPDMPASAFKDMWNTIQSGKLWLGEVKNLKKDGSFYWVKANIAPYYNKNKKHIGYSAIRIDITAQKEVELLHNEVNSLLNNAGQGFLSFDKNMKIDESFSKECLNIFQLDDIKGDNISDILFSNNTITKELFEDGINRALASDETIVKEIFLSLLPKEQTVNNKDISIEYKLLPYDKFMIVLTDITNTKMLEHKIKEQNQIQNMIVAVVSNINDFIELKLDFESFISNPSKDLKVCLRELHTFKGIFSQKEMVYIVDGIHTLETKINEIKQTSDVNINDIFHTYNLQNIFNQDLEIINSTLGDEFLYSERSLNIDIHSLDNLELNIKQLQSEFTDKKLNLILDDIEKFRYESIYSMLNTYPIAVKQMAQILNKEVYPLEIIGDENLNISPKFKPFIKSLIHLFNNCVDHGIDDIETRVEKQKDEIGTINCNFAQINNNIQIIISDDGAGINIDKLSQSAIKNALITEDKLQLMSKDEKLFLIFEDNLSTKDKLSIKSGRGVGMSAIKSELDKLNGKIEIKNDVGYGVKFIFTLPLEKER